MNMKSDLTANHLFSIFSFHIYTTWMNVPLICDSQKQSSILKVDVRPIFTNESRHFIV